MARRDMTSRHGKLNFETIQNCILIMFSLCYAFSSVGTTSITGSTNRTRTTNATTSRASTNARTYITSASNAHA